MGVLNITPDSFSDGGRFVTPEAAMRRADEMVSEGARIIDVGAESTRPGAQAASVDDQLGRIRTVLPDIRQNHPDVPISIDTRSADVAREALALGADIVNDTSALRDDTRMADVVRESGAAIILMHMRGTPATMQHDSRNLEYDDVVKEVGDFLNDRVASAESAGIPKNHIAVDPGIGFGKTVAQNLALIARLDELAGLGRPVVLGASRKSFIGKLLCQEEPTGRLAGSLACAVAGVFAGAQIIRAHDVESTVRAVSIADAIRRAQC